MSAYVKVTITRSAHNDAKKWAKAAFGKPMGDLGSAGTWKDMLWYCQAYTNVSNFWFRDPAQATLFTLRWK